MISLALAPNKWSSFGARLLEHWQKGAKRNYGILIILGIHMHFQ
jgi:hypothetical protein